MKPEAAWTLIDREIRPLATRKVPRDQALFARLGADLAATVDQPPADVSAMDGYALAGEVGAEGASLPVDGAVMAGPPSTLEARPGRALKIMTGAVVPRGADRVVPFESTDSGRLEVRITRLPAAGDNIRRQGEIVRAGAPMLTTGTLLTPAALALAAAHGYRQLPIVRSPRVAVLSTGDEIVAAEEEPGPGQLRDSNSVFLLAAGLSLGWRFESLGIAPDDSAALKELIEKGLEFDVLLLCGGVSRGELDLVEKVLADLGCRQLFDEVAIQPAKPTVAAVHQGGFVLGLPGNPASVMTAFWLFARPLLRRLAGHDDAYWQGALQAELLAAAPGARDRDRFLPAVVAERNGRLLALPQIPKGSHDVNAFSRGTGLLRVPAGAGSLPAGAIAEVLPLASWPLG